MASAPLDPIYFHAPETFGAYQPPGRPWSVTGAVFTPAARSFDFGGVPGFDLSKLQSLWHAPTKTFLYARPIPRPFDLAAVDGTPVPRPPTSGVVLTVQADTSAMSASDLVVAFYDPPPAG